MTAMLVAVCSLAGCNSTPPTYPVSGQVVFADGTPLEGGSVEFRLEGAAGDSPNARGEIAADGAFRLTTFRENDGAVAGRHQVVVVPIVSLVSVGDQAAPPERIDRRFGRYETSGLTAVVEPGGTNRFVLQVEPPKN